MRKARVLRYVMVCMLTLLGLVLYLHATTYVLSANTTSDVNSGVKFDSMQDFLLETDAFSLRQAESDNAARIQRVQNVCHKYNLGIYKHSADLPKIQHPPTPQYGVFYIDQVHKLSWCPIYKAASSTWLFNLCLLGGYSEEELKTTTKQLSDLARAVYQELDASDAELAFQSTLKLLVVRHPFARLLSAYRDKLENAGIGFEHGTKHFYQKYGSAIVKKYRKTLYSVNSTSIEILRSNQYIIDPKLPKPLGLEPTFKEFVNYLIDTDLVHYADDHWIPYYLFCTPCLLQYDVIAQVETMTRDQQYVIQLAGIQNIIKPRWNHKTSAYPGSDIAKAYFSQLNKDEVNKLFNKYKLDFELFGYNMEDYFKLAV